MIDSMCQRKPRIVRQRRRKHYDDAIKSKNARRPLKTQNKRENNAKTQGCSCRTTTEPLGLDKLFNSRRETLTLTKGSITKVLLQCCSPKK